MHGLFYFCEMKKQTGFEKFMSKEKKGAAKKEQLRQEKKKWKQEERSKKEERVRMKAEGGRWKKNDDVSARSDNRNDKPGHQKPGFDNRNSKTRNRPYKFENKDPKSGGRKPKLQIRKATSDTDKKPTISSTRRQERSDPPSVSGIRRVANDSSRIADTMPLNKFIAHGGLCSRRDAAELVKGGKVKVNGELITEPGHKVSEHDEVRVAGKRIQKARNLVYILLNKPKDYITTTDDPQQRKTVLELVKRATSERIYPVGRLDRNTSGVLLLTNDGDLAQKLTHPSNEMKKIYAVTLDKPLTRTHFDSILKGVALEDGMAHVDSLAFTDAKDATQVGIELHSGRNRIVRRIFEHFGYDVKNLDRVMFAGLTKKNVQRGKWRFLSEREVRDLKFFNKGKR